MSDDFTRVGGLLRVDMGETAPPSHHAAQRARLVSAASERATSRLTRLAMPLAVVAVLAVGLVAWLRAVEAPPLGFFVGPSGQPGKEGAYYAALPSGPFPLRFDDGTTVALETGSGVRVTRARRDETVVLLERGTTRFDVRHDAERRWQVAAGAYTIHVTGTEFTVDWNSERNQLVVQMHQGAVLITGPGLDGGVTVKGRERFVSRVTRDLEVGAEPRAAAEPAAPEEAASDEAASEEEASKEEASKDPEVAPPGASVNEPAVTLAARHRPVASGASAVPRGALWSALVVEGAHDRVLEAAEKRGIDRVLRSANSADLRALADAARFRGRSTLARRALESLRGRFPGTARATAAAFVLGRLEDTQGNPAAALRWYDAYLAEGGPLAPEAKGRKMVALHTLGRSEEAKRLAREYLAAHPDGAYAKPARDIAR